MFNHLALHKVTTFKNNMRIRFLSGFGFQKKSYFCVTNKKCGSSSVGRASASQAEGREFESRFPLQKINHLQGLAQ